MKLSPELYFLTLAVLATGLMWIPYSLARVKTRGLLATMGNPNPTLPQDPQWAQRARMAHANAIENLAVFAPLVLVAAMMGVSTPATVLAAKLFLGARLVHFVVYAAGIPIVRTLAFIASVAAMLIFAFTLLA